MQENKRKPLVHIILAAYNGSNYITKQLDSLMAQTYDNIRIYIRDDGSTDNTVWIIQNYIKEHGAQEKIVLLDNGGVNLRCPKSFYEILKCCEKADYYSLCDQDDEWYPQKVQWAVERLEAEKKEQVLLYYTACDYRTSDGTFIRHSPVQKEELELSDVLYYTPGSGFTIVFNEQARQELLQNVEPGPELHDRWLIRGAVLLGKVIYDKRSSATHIRHEDAVTSGDAGTGNLLTNFVKAELMGPDAGNDKRALGYFYKTFYGHMTEAQRREVQLFAGKNTPLKWVKKVFYPKRLRTRLMGEAALRILFFLGRI